jgi:hypothetical protein
MTVRNSRPPVEVPEPSKMPIAKTGRHVIRHDERPCSII